MKRRPPPCREAQKAKKLGLQTQFAGGWLWKYQFS
jgi:hypothetical protein